MVCISGWKHHGILYSRFPEGAVQVLQTTFPSEISGEELAAKRIEVAGCGALLVAQRSLLSGSPSGPSAAPASL